LRPLHLILAVIAIAAIALPIIVVRLAPPIPERAFEAPPTARRIVTTPKVPPPPVEPVEYASIDPDDARAVNAAIPFVNGPVPAARPFRFVGGTEDFARATDCLAAAAYYEAGDDPPGQKAVAQVVLNRLRHPAFPKTVCGVVFQGAERATGCQFTFTCDGALGRTPSPAAWQRARDVATRALRGSVYKPVGWATHYHTDWVVPYWSSSLDKIAELHTHLFFRWTGWWGTGPAFNRGQQPGEAPIAKLAAVSDIHRIGADGPASAAALAAAPYKGTTPAPLGSDNEVFLTRLNPAQAASYPAMAMAACGARAVPLHGLDHRRCRRDEPAADQRSDACHVVQLHPRSRQQSRTLPVELRRIQEPRILHEAHDAPRRAGSENRCPRKGAGAARGRPPEIKRGAGSADARQRGRRGIRNGPAATCATGPIVTYAARNISGGSAISASAPPSIWRR
jgi:spore germination cell wall hydrolase CwlJ-like protein